MNRLVTNRVRAFEAEQREASDFSRPVRMQGAAWGDSAASLRSYAWGRAARQKSIWRRALLTGVMASLVGGAAGMGQPFGLGAVVMAAACGVQMWQSVEMREAVSRAQMN